MEKEIVEEKIRKEKARRKRVLEEIGKGIRESSNYNTHDEEFFYKNVGNKNYKLIYLSLSDQIMRRYFDKGMKDYDEVLKIIEPFERLIFDDVQFWNTNGNDFKEMIDHQCDTEPTFFSGDILITDPGYILREYDDENDIDYESMDWAKCGYGFNMENLGFTTYLTKWKEEGYIGTIRNTDTGRKMGEFHVEDLISVFLLDEVLKYNPKCFKRLYDYNVTATIIKDFEGTIQIVLEEKQLQYKKKGDLSYIAKIIGHGKNKITGKLINFMGSDFSSDDMVKTDL